MRAGLRGGGGQGRFRLKEVVAWRPQGSAGCQLVTVTSPRSRPPTRGPPGPQEARGAGGSWAWGTGCVWLQKAPGWVGRLWHPSQECPGQAASTRGLQLSLGGGLWEAKNGLCSPRAGLFPPSPCPGTLHPWGDWGRQPSGHTPCPGLLVGAAGGTLPSPTRPGAEEAGPPSPPLLSAGSVGCGRENGQHGPEGGVTMHEASSTRKPPPAGPERHRLGWVRTLQKWVRG